MPMLNVILCVLGTLGFCSILNAPIKKIPYILTGAFISASVFEIMSCKGIGIFLSTASASTAIGLYSECIARLIKAPATIIMLPSAIPLLPGGSLYYTMSNIIIGNNDGFRQYAMETIYTGFGIAIGVIITSIIMRLVLRRN